MLCGLAAGAWLGAAEAPTKLVTLGISPFIISLGMVAGVFVARWTVPTIMKGTEYIFIDLRDKAHLIVWAIIAGALWAVANTLTVFAIRDVGLSIAFPLWNTNCLVGLFWGWFFFRELRGAGKKAQGQVLGGAVGIAGGAVLLAYASASAPLTTSAHATAGILAALGAGLLWGTMYIPYRKAYLSGMNPLSFVTVFTVGELGTVAALALVFRGGLHPVLTELAAARPALFWLFLGGFCWVLGDLFQQYAAKYIGIGRGIPLSNTNQIWGLAWGALVFGELAGRGSAGQLMVVAGSAVMILGALAISRAEAPATEHAAWSQAIERECDRYGLNHEEVFRAQAGEDVMAERAHGWRWWDIAIVAAAVGIFVWLAHGTTRPPIEMHPAWIVILLTATLGLLVAGAVLLWKRTRFS
ncbi:MAG TPA: EamA family transporter [Terriglobia bacterium]|nr:EamA family transporter [Terriglobia bacterium]